MLTLNYLPFSDRPWRPPPEPSGIPFPESRWIPICTASGYQIRPDIYENFIVWADDRDNEDYYEVYLYDLETETETLITEGKGGARAHPKIFGNYVVWNHGYYNNLIVYNIETEELIEPSVPEGYSPARTVNFAVHGDYIVYDRASIHPPYNYRDHDIILYNIPANTFTELYTGETGEGYGYEDQRDPEMWSLGSGVTLFVWEERTPFSPSASSSEIFYDHRPIPGGPSSLPIEFDLDPFIGDLRKAKNPSIGLRQNQPRIVYEDNRFHYSDWDLFYIDMHTMDEYLIPATGGGLGYPGARALGLLPDIYENLIVWVDERYDRAGDIFLFDDTPSEEYRYSGRIFRLTGEGEQDWPAVYGDYIVFQHRREGNWDIYMIDLSQPAGLLGTAYLAAYVYGNDLALATSTIIAVSPFIVIVAIQMICEKYPEVCEDPPLPGGRQLFFIGISNLAMLLSSFSIYYFRPSNHHILILGSLIFGGSMMYSYIKFIPLLSIISRYRSRS